MTDYIVNNGVHPGPDAVLEEIIFTDEHSLSYQDLLAAGVTKARNWRFSRTGNSGEIKQYKLRKHGA